METWYHHTVSHPVLTAPSKQWAQLRLHTPEQSIWRTLPLNGSHSLRGLLHSVRSEATTSHHCAVRQPGELICRPPRSVPFQRGKAGETRESRLGPRHPKAPAAPKSPAIAKCLP
jgi:hypothetical protein